jgi:hypothetical protein
MQTGQRPIFSTGAASGPQIISIALCTYNGERYLTEQLQSLLEQTRLPDELVVGDDVSTDRTLVILQDFKKKAPFDVHLYSNATNIGYVRNFENTILRSRGDIIFPSDQDDIWDPRKIETISKVFERDAGTKMVVTNAELIDSHSNSLGGDLLRSFGVSRKLIDTGGVDALGTLLFARNFVSGNTVAARSELCSLLADFPAPPGSAHDHWLGVIAASHARLRIIDFKSIKYRQHSAQIFGVRKGRVKTSGFPERCEQIIETAEAQAESYDRLADALPLFSLRKETEGEADGLLEQSRAQLKRKVSELHGRSSHYRRRQSLGEKRLMRFPKILSELSTGGYRQYSSGLKSAAYDLFRR